MGIEPVFVENPARPSFVTVTRTTGADRGHLDVSLGFLLFAKRGMPLTIDRTELAETRWRTPADVAAADPQSFDPHYRRFMMKVCR